MWKSTRQKDIVVLGVDIGGTEIKFGVISGREIIAKKQIDTLYKDDTEKLVDYIAKECQNLIDEYGVKAVGVGVPGNVVENKVTSSNLPFRNTPLSKMLSEKLKMEVFVENDANCAGYGELVWCNEEKYKNIVMITIGTGIGGSIIIDNKIYRGMESAGEIGHMIIERDGRPCNCGLNGCFEQYASITALIRDAVEAAKNNPESFIFKVYEENENKLDGKLFFKALQNNCEVAKKVFDKYTDYLSMGLVSLVNIFSPEAIIVAGGITKEGDAFLNPIREKIKRDIPIKISKLQNDAGIVGAAMLGIYKA